MLGHAIQPEQPGPYNTDRRRSGLVFLVVCYLATIGLMWVMKRHYSAAGAEQLRWILHAMAALVSWLDGNAYTWEAGIGYVRADHRFIIAPACAGINFMIMAFGLTVAAFLHQCRSSIERIIAMIGALAGAYLLTIVVNALRIVLSVRLYEYEVAWGWLNAERLHRLAGVGVYFSALGLYYGLLKRIIHRKRDQSRPCPRLSAVLPWAWYVVGTVAVPMASRIYRGRGLPETEHWLTVIGASALLWGFGLAAFYLFKACRANGRLGRRPDQN